MALANRIGRLFRADLHAVLDRIEEPAEVLRQSIRDMQQVIFQGERDFRSCGRQLAGLEQSTRQVEALLQATDGELDVCFEKQEHVLARAVIRKKLGIERRQKQLSARIEELSELQADLASTLDRQRKRVEALRQKAEVFLDPGCDDLSCISVRAPDRATVSDDDVEIAFLREQRARAAS